MVKESVLNFVSKNLVRLYSKIMLDLDLQKYPNLPKGPKIFVANHPSTTDPFLINNIASDRSNILIHGELFKIPVFGFFLKHLGHIPVHDDHRRPLVIEDAKKKLNRGESLCIFIEGGISPLSGGFLPPHTGAARLALSHCVPIIPIGISLDRQKIKLIKSKVDDHTETGTWYLRGPYAATVGRPMYFVGDVNDRNYVNTVTQNIMNNIIQLSAKSKHRIQQNHSYTLNSLV